MRSTSARDVADAHLLYTIIDVHAAARRTYGARPVHAELTLGRRLEVGRRRVERLTRAHQMAGETANEPEAFEQIESRH